MERVCRYTNEYFHGRRLFQTDRRYHRIIYRSIYGSATMAMSISTKGQSYLIDCVRFSNKLRIDLICSRYFDFPIRLLNCLGSFFMSYSSSAPSLYFMQLHFFVLREVPLGTKERAESLMLDFEPTMSGTRLFPSTDLGMGKPVNSQAVGNKSTSSTMEELIHVVLFGDLIIKGTRVTSYLRLPFCQK